MATGPGSGTNYNYSQLRQLWLQAGGNKAWSYVMAAIAMAESGGNPRAQHLDQNNSVDRGLWQINSVHGYSADSSFNPIDNAKQAVAVFKSSGPHAWSTYNNGAYLNYMPGGKSSPSGGSQSQYPGLVNPVPQGTYERVDQGVDYGIVIPTKAVAAGVVAFIDPNFYQGTPAVYEKLDKPITVGGRSYPGVYYSETGSLVHKGQRLKPGQDVTKAGNVEVGFAKTFGNSWLPAAHGQYTEGVPTQAGKDFEQLVVALGAQSPGTISSTSGIPNTVTDLAGDAKKALFGGIEGLVWQAFFILIGLGLIVVGLALVAWTLMGKVGAPGIVGMAQTQMRISQAGTRQVESGRAARVRESQAQQRIVEQRSTRELRERRVAVSEGHNVRRESEPTHVMYPDRARLVRYRKKTQ